MTPATTLSICIGLTALVALPACSEPPDPGSASRIAIEKLVADTGLREEDVTLTQAQAAEWPDSSLGCAKKGLSYQPVVTAGYVVQVMTKRSTYTVHVAGDRAVLCAEAQHVPHEAAARDESALDLVRRAQAVLAAKLGEGHAPITVKSMRRVRVGENEMSCEERPDDGVPGLAVELQSGEKTYMYFAGNGHVLACDP